MKKLILLLFITIVFNCSSDNENEICLTCTEADFINISAGTEYNCNYDIEVCVGAVMASVCFPPSISGFASELNIDDINAIKLLWEENGANCTLD